MQRQFSGLSQQMLIKIDTISDQMSHKGEKGRNNETIVKDFLVSFLPHRYTVSTGKIIAANGAESGQVDLIIHDRLETPALLIADAWSIVPVESVFAVISVKTSLDKSQLRDAMQSIASVRSLPRTAAQLPLNGKFVSVEGEEVLRPRSFVFSFKSNWSKLEGCESAFTELLDEFEDDLRPNAICILDSGFLVRKAYTKTLISYGDHALLHFFQFLIKTVDSRPRYRTDLSLYISEEYGQAKK